jgi:hypothetical protein
MPDKHIDADDDKPKIDLHEALGEAGHEVKDLGYEGVADTGKVVEPDEDNEDLEHAVSRDIAVEFPSD